MLQTGKHVKELTRFVLPFQQNQKAIFKATFILTKSQVQICTTSAIVLDHLSQQKPISQFKPVIY